MNKKSVVGLESWTSQDRLFTKQILRSGSGSITPNEGSICNVVLNIYECKRLSYDLLGGYLLDTNCEVTIGDGVTFLADLFDQVIMTMEEGEQCYVKSKVDFRKNKVVSGPKGQIFKFKIELVSFSRSAEMIDLLADEKLEMAEHHKIKGTELYNKNLDLSLRRFKKALEFLVQIDEKQVFHDQKHLYRLLKLQCNLNLAAGKLKKKLYSEVIEHCNQALSIDPNNVKGLYRRGRALIKTDDLISAKNDLKQALVHEPENQTILSSILEVEKALDREKRMCKRMFS